MIPSGVPNFEGNFVKTNGIGIEDEEVIVVGETGCGGHGDPAFGGGVIGVPRGELIDIHYECGGCAGGIEPELREINFGVVGDMDGIDEGDVDPVAI